MRFLESRFHSNLVKKFSRVYRKNLFLGSESLSGRGSDSDQTKVITAELPPLLSKLGVSTLLDIPCGDLNWMRHVSLEGVAYVGADIVPELVEKLSIEFHDSDRKFLTLSAVNDNLPGSFDAIFCRDLLVHLSTQDIMSALRNFKASGSTYLLTTHFTDLRKYKNLPLLSLGVGWRPINFNLAPFGFPLPELILNEGCTEAAGAYSDKSIAVWRLKELPL